MISSVDPIQTLPVLEPSFYARPTEIVAVELLGKTVVSNCEEGKLTAGKIVETEAYLGTKDPGAHAFRGPTPRTQLLWDSPGFAYVYLIYGMHHCLNFVTESKGTAGCVLIRALEPLVGIPTMKQRRGIHLPTEQLTSGPGKLTKALAIDLKHNGTDLAQAPLSVHDTRNRKRLDVVKTTRIGLTKGVDRKLRFYINNNKFVSKR